MIKVPKVATIDHGDIRRLQPFPSEATRQVKKLATTFAYGSPRQQMRTSSCAAGPTFARQSIPWSLEHPISLFHGRHPKYRSSVVLPLVSIHVWISASLVVCFDDRPESFWSMSIRRCREAAQQKCQLNRRHCTYSNRAHAFFVDSRASPRDMARAFVFILTEDIRMCPYSSFFEPVHTTHRLAVSMAERVWGAARILRYERMAIAVAVPTCTTHHGEWRHWCATRDRRTF